ncbi:DUF1049 domain-containing protein [Streptomyces sp. NPDC059176]|uniref:DUF1049 domain-containing protein n=1 Tax=unclassified Streptomyces TaxID=2593676 RepID=UPI0036B8ADA7
MSPKDAATGVKSKDGWRSKLSPSRIGILVLAVISLVFIFENTTRVTIRLLIPEVTMPLFLALLATWIIGGLCGGYVFRRRTR